MRIGSHQAKNTTEEHLLNFYHTWDEVKDRKFDGFIITGAPIETLPFENVSYWKEMEEILDWTTTHVHSSFFVCWGAMAAAWHFHRVPKHDLPEKAFGIFRHKNLAPANPYLSGFSDDFQVSVSRWTEVRREDLTSDFDILMESPETGLCLLHETFANRLYIFNHIEYDSGTLADEYYRDIEAGRTIGVPKNYFPDDDPEKKPLNRWRSHAFLLFGNWITQVYQTTPFDMAEIGHSKSAGQPSGGVKMSTLTIRPLEVGDEAEWRRLWTGYLEYYETTVPEEVYQTTFSRLLIGNSGTENEYRGFLAETENGPCGLVHFLFHRHCWRVENVCYLQDLYADPSVRGAGVGSGADRGCLRGG